MLEISFLQLYLQCWLKIGIPRVPDRLGTRGGTEFAAFHSVANRAASIIPRYNQDISADDL